MTINLYNNTSDKKKIGKSLTLVSSLVGVPREENTIVEPRILIESSGVPSANYAYIPEYSRYYYIVNKTWVRDKFWLLDMHVDVRETYASQIKANTPILERSQYLYNLYLPDPKLPTESDSFTVTYDLGGDFDHNGLYILFSDCKAV